MREHRALLLLLYLAKNDYLCKSFKIITSCCGYLLLCFWFLLSLEV